MSKRHFVVLALGLATLLTACSSGRMKWGDMPYEMQNQGIRTASIHAAPATQPANNDSQPLSEQTGYQQAVAQAAVAEASQSTPAASLAKGGTARAVSNAAMRLRPTKSSDAVNADLSGALELGPQIYNADGYWWYVTAGKESGWMLQTELLP